MKSFKEFRAITTSTHAIQRANERNWSDEERNLFSNPVLQETLITRLRESLGEDPDTTGFDYFIFRRHNFKLYAAIGIFKMGFIPGEGLKALIQTYLPHQNRYDQYDWKNVVWTIRVNSDTDVSINPDKTSNPPTFMSKPGKLNCNKR